MTAEHGRHFLNVQIILSTKFQLKLKILIFWTKFNQREYFRSKTEKVNITLAVECRATWSNFPTQRKNKKIKH